MGQQYTEAFSTTAGHCFRFVRKAETGHDAQHCQAPVQWIGQFRDSSGFRYRVESCADHVDALIDLKPIYRSA